MREFLALSRAFWLLSLLILVGVRTGAQTVQSLANIKSQAELDETVGALDSALFDSYNKCDTIKFGALLTDDVEFYDDRNGLSVGRQRQIDDLKKYICGKATRELVPGTLQVSPLGQFGAMEIGTHRFHHPGHDDTEPVGEGKFILIWQCKDGAWRVTRT